MKKFGKILTLLLSLVFIITAFTVVSLATDEATEPSEAYTANLGRTWENADLGWGDNFGSGVGRYGFIYTEFSDSQNKYAVFTANPRKTASTNSDTAYYGEALSLPTAKNGKVTYQQTTTVDGVTTTKEVSLDKWLYNPKDYPYLVYEFDTMTPTGVFGTDTNVAMDGITFRTFKGTTDTKSTALSIGTFNLFSKLDNTPYKWQHVTLVARYKTETNVDATTGLTVAMDYDIDLYVDGTYVDTFANYASADAKKVVFGIPAEAIGYSFIRQSALKITKDYGADPSLWTEHPMDLYDIKVAYDNPTIAYYKADWSSEDIAADRWEAAKNLVPTGGKAVASVIDSEGNEVYYGDLSAAIDAAGTTDTVKILADVVDPVLINKEVKIDTAKVYTYSSTDYIVGKYKLLYYTNSGFAANYNGDTGVYNFTATTDTYTINWDPDCEGDCTCDESVAHIYKATTVAAVGNELSPIKRTTFDFKDGLSITLLGWSYTKGGDVIQLSEVSASVGETVNLYPVYEVIQYGIEVISPTGTSTFYLPEDYQNAIEYAPAGATVMLHTDIVANDVIYFYCAYSDYANANRYRKSITFDLNGNSLSRIRKAITQYSATLNENGEYVKGEALGAETVSCKVDYFFYLKSYSGYTFTIKSSRPGATIDNLTVKAEEWVDENGKVVKTVVKSTTSGGGLFSLYPASSTFNIYGENIEFHTGKLFYGEHGSNNANLKINIDGGTFYSVSGETPFQIYHGGNHSVKNATFVCHGSSIASITKDKGTSFTFENCNLVDSTGASFSGATESLTFINCRMQFDALSFGSGSVSLGDDCLLVNPHENVTLASGLERASVSYVQIYYYHTPEVASDLKTVKFNEATKKVTFAYEIANSATDFATVIWQDADGETVETSENVLKSAYVSAAPKSTIKFPVGDGLRGYTNPVWLNADGSAADLLLGKRDGNLFTFKASMPENPNYVAYITDAMFNLSYYGHFGYNLYVPKVEGVIYDQIGDYKASGMYDAVINGVNYIYANAGWIGPADALTQRTKYVNYTIDGVSYSAAFKLSADIYAELLLCDTETVSVERDAMLKLMKYAEESYKFKGISEANQTKFDNFFNTYNAGARPENETEYPQNELHTVDSVFSTHVSEIGYTIYSNGRYSLVAKLNKAAVEAGYTLKITGMTSSIGPTMDSDKNVVYNDDGSLTYFTNNTGLAGGIMYPESVITVCDAEGNVIAETSYSLATYIAGVKAQSGNTALAEALYSFGKAVIKVRAYIATK